MEMLSTEVYLTLGKKGRVHWPELATPKLTKTKPRIPKGHVAIKLKLEVPKALFEEFIPSGTITLPEDASIGRPAIEVLVPEDVHVTPDVKLALMVWDEDEEEAV